jgi:DNA-binding LytR/AlgR family response regulator
MSGIDGMETARELRKKDKKVILIFVTAVEEYVFQEFDVGAFNYIVKPIDDGKFSDVLHRAVDEWSSQNINEKEPEERYVLINNSGVHTKVILDEIVYAEVFNRKVVSHKLDGEIEYYGKMSDLESLAGDSFFRPHRAYLINFKYVEKYDATTIYLERGTVLMAKQNYPEFVKKYMKYIQKRG